jgi:CHAD domain-containing protein
MAKARPITGLDPQTPTGKNARIIARIRLEELFSWESYVDNPYHIQELHNLRIAAKRLRYTFEVFEDVLPVASKDIVKELVKIQDELGVFHDTDVMIASLRLCLGGQDSAAVFDSVQSDTSEQHREGKSLVPPELVADRCPIN